MGLHIVADENISQIRNAVSSLITLSNGREDGSLTLLPGRAITRESLKDCDVLLVRSVTKINEQLLNSTPVKFVGTATSGEDHCDQVYLKKRGIYFASARGSNAQGVVDYVFAVLAFLGVRRGLRWRDSRIGIVGAGEVGGRLAQTLLRLGCSVLIADPHHIAQQDKTHPLAPYLAPLDEVLQQPIVSLHTPLIDTGTHPTRHLLCEESLSLMSANVALINTARGGVIDNTALLKWCQEQTETAVVLDVWESEPLVPAELFHFCVLGTPHIAGYSAAGKLRGTTQLIDSLGSWLGQTIVHSCAPLKKRILHCSPKWTLDQLILSAYNIELDHDSLASLFDQPGVNREDSFDYLRKNYLPRYEFNQSILVGADSIYKSQLKALGFQLEA